MSSVVSLVTAARTFVKVTSSNTPYTMLPMDDITLDSSGGGGTQVQSNLPAAPVAGEIHSFAWIAGAIPPIIGGNGKLVASWGAGGVAQNGGSSATQVIDILGGCGKVQYDGTQWWWIG